MTVPAHGHLSTRLIQTSISKSMPFFRISSLNFPFCTQELLSVDGMKVFSCPSAKQPLWSSTLFLKLTPLFLAYTSVVKLFVSRWRLVHQFCTSSCTGTSSALPSTRMHSISLWSPVVQVQALILPLHSQSLPSRQSVEQDFLEKSTAPFSKKSSSDMNKQPTNPTDFNEKTVKRHSPDTLTRAAKQTWSQSFTLHIQIARPWGQTFQSNSPLSGGQVLTSAPPPLGLNIDRCITRVTMYLHILAIGSILFWNETQGLKLKASPLARGSVASFASYIASYCELNSNMISMMFVFYF